MSSGFDLFHLPGVKEQAQQIFWPSTHSSGQFTGWQAWRKPAGYTMLWVTAIGAGGGGGGGCGGAAASNRGGGGGAGAGMMTRLMIPLSLLPDTLYLYVGAGGVGGGGGIGGAASPGTSGERSYISVTPIDTTPAATVLLVSAGGGTAGGAGTPVAAGSSGSGGSTANAAVGYYAIFNTSSGLAGSAGGTHLGGVVADVTPSATVLQIMPGCGGAGIQSTPTAGGRIVGVANTPYSVGHLGGAEALGDIHGKHAYRVDNFFSYGGTGGGSSNTTTGGNGGSATNVPGAGGGGGGAGTTTGGTGGNGGPGLIIMTCF